MPKFFVRLIDPTNTPNAIGEWREVEADNEEAAVESLTGYSVAEGAKPADACAEARAGTKAGLGRIYRRRQS